MAGDDLKSYLDALADEVNTSLFIADDPVQFPRRFSERRDIEIAAFLTALIAWGGRKQILRSCEKLFGELMQNRPYSFVAGGAWQDLDGRRNLHRTFFCSDLAYMCRGLQAWYAGHGSLEDFFAGRSVWEGIAALRAYFLSVNGCYSKHLADPAASACKRLHLMLRWLCRNDGRVDLGLWKRVKPAALMIPLDLHVARSARELGLLDGRKANDRKTVEQLTARLRAFCPEDPVKYDYALFGYGLRHKA